MTALLQLFDKSPGLRFAPPCLVHFTCTACTTGLLGTMRMRRSGTDENTPSSRRTVDQSLQECIALLGRMGRPFRHTVQHVEALQRMFNESSRTGGSLPSLGAIDEATSDSGGEGPQPRGQARAFPTAIDDLFDPFDYINPIREMYAGGMSLMDDIRGVEGVPDDHESTLQ